MESLPQSPVTHTHEYFELLANIEWIKSRMKKDKFNRETVPCKWCGTQTPMIGTELCDRCWELDGRIRRDLDIAKKIVAFYSEVPSVNHP